MKLSKLQHFEVNYSVLCVISKYIQASLRISSFDGPKLILSNYSFESLLFLVSHQFNNLKPALENTSTSLSHFLSCW